MRCWRWGLPSLRRPPAVRLIGCSMQPGQQAAGGVHAVLGLRPDAAAAARRAPSSVTSSPRWAGRQCRKTAVGAGRGHQRVVDGEALEGLAPAPSASASWPIDVHTSV